MSKIIDIYGMVTVGARGQVVIPNQARAEHKIKAGDKLLVMSGPPGRKKFIIFVPMSNMEEMMRHLENHVKELSRFSKKQNRAK